MHMEELCKLDDQTEVQRSLKLKMESQSRFFDRIADDHRNRAAITAKFNYKPSSSSSASLPPLEESESNAKEFESDSDGDVNQIQSEEFQALKRMKMTQYNDVSSTPLFKVSEVSYGAHEGISFPWSNIASCPSPLVPSFF
ncbi:protein PHR1-LIKE 1-like [Tripterygium wilfordii]|uniref:Protein PHR1-LIKE 1-like n=2 Tax=Tripterygium wilfordii TaxID=458696 RepID=A0A7J7DXD0_TRIWF|nr:protein PHR1-LIKE 1-like [Tripterygium wilfordii]